MASPPRGHCQAIIDISRKLNGAFQMVAATAIIWAVGVIIATYAGTPPSFVVILIVL